MSSGVRDSAYSWVVAVSGCFMYFIMYGLGRTSGLLFVETLTFFNTDRQTASFPFTLACALRYLAGPIAGSLAGRLGLRFMIVLGSIMAAVGVGGCFLATSITAIAVLWGGLFGLGSGISSTQLPQINNLYFTKHLTKANGISYAGAAIAGFVLPPIMEGFLHQYGISGAYLLLSGIALHAIPAAILLREPATEKLPMISFEIPEEIKENYKRRLSDLSVVFDNTKRIARRLSQRCTPDILSTAQNKPEDKMEVTLISNEGNNTSNRKKSSSFSCHGNGISIRGKTNTFSFSEKMIQNINSSKEVVAANVQNMFPFKMSKTASLSEIKEGVPLEVTSSVLTDDKLHSCTAEVTIHNCNIPQDVLAINLQNMLPLRKIKTESLSEIKENEPLDIIRTEETSVPITELTSISRQASMCSKSGSCYGRKTSSVSFTNSEGKIMNIQDKGGICYIECLSINEDTEHHEQPPNMCLNDISIFWDLKFFLISFTASINGFYCFVLPAILIDFCRDKGITTMDATYIMMAFSICDMVGRLGFGWITDSKYMSKANFCAVCFFVLSACLAFFALATGLIPMFLILSILGMGLGAHTPLPTGLISEYIETSKHTMANASFDILGVPFLLSTPSMIGYFRDGLGSYDLFVYLLCVISFVCGLMMLLLPYIQRRAELQKNEVVNIKL